MRRQDRAALAQRKGEFSYAGAVSRIPEALAPPIHTHSFSVTQTVSGGKDTSGPLFAMGGRFGGIGLYLRQGVPVAAFRSMDGTLSVVTANRTVSAKSTIGMSFRRLGNDAAHISLTIDGSEAGSGQVAGPLSVFAFSSNETFDIGSDTGTKVLSGDMPTVALVNIETTAFRVELPATKTQQ